MGARSFKHYAIAIRLDALLKGKISYSCELYDHVASTLGMPTSRRLQAYTIPTTNKPGGILLANVLREAELFDTRNPNTGFFDWQRHYCFAFDSMTCKRSFVVNYHTNKIVGLGADHLRFNVILNKLKKIKSKDRMEEQLEEEKKTEQETFEVPEFAKHFLIFACTTLSPTSNQGKCTRHQFVCDRYGLTSNNSAFLIPQIRKIVLHLSFYSFIVNMITGDGAYENRSTFKSLADKTAREILTGHYPTYLLDTLNLDFKITFSHPNSEHAKEITMFIGADMRHWVKKFRNAMDNKRSIDVTFHGCGLILDRLHDIHTQLKDTEVSSRADIRVYKFGAEHFTLNSFNKMRVFLAIHILSLITVRTIKDFCGQDR